MAINVENKYRNIDFAEAINQALIQSMKLDKKTIDRAIKLILVRGIGNSFISNKVNEKKLSLFLKNNGFD